MVQWRDVDPDHNDGADETNTQQASSPFGVGPVDKIAFVDDDSLVELRGAEAIAAIEPPAPREKPARPPQQRERKWLPADPPPAPKSRSNVLARILQALVAVVIFGGLTYGAWMIISAYQSETQSPPAPISTLTPSAPAAEPETTKAAK